MIGEHEVPLLDQARITLDKALGAQNMRALSTNVGFFPVLKGDKEMSTTFKGKVPFTGALIGLRVKKNKLFGKITSDWKE